LKLIDFYIVKVINEVIATITSRERLRQVISTHLYINAFYLMLNTALMSLFGFFFWLIVARFYTEAEVGFSSAIISAISLLALLGIFGLNASLVRFLPQIEKLQEFINTCFTLSGLITLVLAGIFLAGLAFWSPALAFIQQNVIFASAFLIFTVLWTLSNLVDFTFVAKRRAGFVLSKNTVFSLLKLPLPIIFVSFFHTFGVVASWGVALGIALAVSLFLFLPRVQDFYKPIPTLKINLIKDMWRYSVGNHVVNLLAVAPVFILPIMVVNILGAESNAYYYITWMIATALFAIPTAVSQSLFAEGSHFEEKLGENVMKSFKFTYLLLIPAVVLLILLGKWLLLAFGQSYSANSLKLLWILCLASLPLGTGNIYASILRVTNRIKELMIIRGLMAVAVLLASYLIMPSTGIIGIGYTWLGTQIAGGE